MRRILSWIMVISLFLTVFPLSPAAGETVSEKALMLPAGLTEIEDSAFEGNTAVTTVIIPNTVMKIGTGAFRNCTGIKEIAFGSEDIEIAEDAFDGCSTELVFTIQRNTAAEQYAMMHGFKTVSLEDDNTYSERFYKLLAYSGFSTSILMSDEYASKCLIIRTPEGSGRLPDISDYHPEYVFQSENDLFFVQFNTENDTRDCFLMLKAQEGSKVVSVEVDHAGEGDSGSRNVAVASWWGTSDPMCFTEYSNFVNNHSNGNVTIAVVDSGVNSWNGKSFESISFVDSNGNNSGTNHASNIAEIISDCVGVNRNRINLLSVKILNSGSVYRTTTIIQGLKYAAEHADIVNLSLGIDAESPEIKHQIDKATGRGVLIVAAAGNGTTGNVLFPARYAKTIAVSALSYSKGNGYRVCSRTGSSIDFTAPGMKLAISSNPDLTAADDTLNLASTSYAAPQITAALALIQLDISKSGSAVNILASCCDTLNEEGYSNAYGNGLPRLNQLAKVEAEDIVLSNAADDAIPDRMWVGDSFLLMWKFVPEDTTNRAVTVTSEDPQVIEVQQFGNAYALIKAKSIGNGKVTVTTVDGKVTKDINFNVEQPVTKITITGASEKLVVNKTMQLGTIIEPGNAQNTNCTWRSSNTGVATVSATGLVTGLSAGTVRIYAESQDGYGVSSYVVINVVEIPDAESVTISSPDADLSSREVTMEVGQTLQLDYTILPEAAPQEVIYRALPSGYVEVSKDGEIRALKAGYTTVMVTATTGQGVVDYLSITVKVSPAAVSITTPQTTLDIGEGMQMQATITPANATDRELTWESSNTAVAIVNSNGYVTAVSPGTAQISVRTVNGKEDSINIEVRKPIVITLDANGGNVQEGKIYAFAGYAIGDLPTGTRSYYTFANWYTKANGGSRVTSASVFNDDTTIYAHWTANQYTVSFDANEGSCATGMMQARVDTAVGALPEPTRPGYTFVGWYTDKTGGIKVTSTYIQTTTAALQLYAHWTAKPYTITLNANGGNCSETSVQAEVDAPIGNLPAANRTGYTFSGWFTEDNVQVTASFQQHTDDILRLFAHWTPNQYTITLDPGDGDCITTEVIGTVDTPLGSLPVAERQYYRFDGWFTNANIQVTTNYQQATDEPITFYAHWTPNSFVITLDANGGNCNTATLTGYVGTAIGNLPNAVRQYYQLAGWFKSKDADAEQVTATYQQDTDSPITVYAHWMPNSYTMMFDANGGDCSITSKEGKVATAIGTLPEPTRTNYRFDGWFTSKNETGTLIDSTYAQTHDEDITVYAHWTLLTYWVTFDVNAGDATCDTDTKQATAGIELGDLPSPKRDYYTFIGWYTSDDEHVTESYVQSTASPMTVYAHWELNPESGWVTTNNVPENVMITQSKWRYKEVTESTASSLSGWTNSGNYWKQTGSGALNYASFPSGFKTDHWIYQQFGSSGLSASETATYKRTVSNQWSGYVYWHWMYDRTYSTYMKVAISPNYGYWDIYGNSGKGYLYQYFYAFTSGTAAPLADPSPTGYCCSQGLTSYNCVDILPAGFPTDNHGGVGTPRFFRFDYYTSYYTDYTKYYNFYRYLESSSQVNVGGSITEVTKYVKYRAK